MPKVITCRWYKMFAHFAIGNEDNITAWRSGNTKIHVKSSNEPWNNSRQQTTRELIKAMQYYWINYNKIRTL